MCAIIKKDPTNYLEVITVWSNNHGRYIYGIGNGYVYLTIKKDEYVKVGMSRSHGLQRVKSYGVNNNQIIFRTDDSLKLERFILVKIKSKLPVMFGKEYFSYEYRESIIDMFIKLINIWVMRYYI